jgi:hypothetical protein
MSENPLMPLELEQLHLQTPSARGPDGTSRMIVLRTRYYEDVTKASEALRKQFWATVAGNMHMLITIDKLSQELTAIDEQCIVPRPEQILTAAQCDDVLAELNAGLARVGRIWALAYTAQQLCDYEVSLIEKWLREKFRLEDARNMDAMIGVVLQDEKRHIVKLSTLEHQAERTYKRIETQLPSLRDLSERRYTESRYHQAREGE